MNLGHLDLHSVHRNRPQLERVLTSEPPVTPLNVRLEADRSPSFASSTSEPETIVRWQTPPSRNRSQEQSTETLRPDNYTHPIGVNEAAYRSDTPLVVRFDEEQIRSNEAQASRRDRNMDNVSLDSSPPTPIDDTPYIRFAIDQLTRDEDIRAIQRPSTTTSSDSYPVERIVPDNGLGYTTTAEREREALALIRKHRSSPAEGRLFGFNTTRPLSFPDPPVPNLPLRHHRTSDPEIFIPVNPPRNTPRHPELTRTSGWRMEMDDSSRNCLDIGQHIYFDSGLMWDARSLADIVALLPRSNCLRDYPGTDIMRKREDIQHKLDLRSDRLGYWRTPNANQGIFYCIGEEGASTRQYTLQSGKIHEKTTNMDDASDIEKAAQLYNTNTRFRYIPWFLRDTFVIFWSVAAFFLLLALFIVSFLPSTAIRYGFPPLVNVIPNSAGYSPANFLYSFIPAIIGMFLYLFFQPLDMAVRKLQPWAELGSPHGAIAEQSLLLDYPALLPIECTFKALRNGHYRVALLSLLSFVFILLPILAGGLFFPLTTPSNTVRMIPNLPSFYIILALLILYLFGLISLIPNRHALHLPHGVDCLAEILSFVYSSQILDDAAFRAPKSKADLATRLMATKVRGERNRYAFGVYRGRNGQESLGVERLGRRGMQDVMVISGR
ncbi:hypothetical protein EG329_000652 [Mollisiaceae sp. DMI_Dod_QoI]|nr:hypothetical protein EG329_000652 [Helotiales sp. DMI_Dod_QoI]